MRNQQNVLESDETAWAELTRRWYTAQPQEGTISFLRSCPQLVEDYCRFIKDRPHLLSKKRGKDAPSLQQMLMDCLCSIGREEPEYKYLLYPGFFKICKVVVNHPNATCEQYQKVLNTLRAEDKCNLKPSDVNGTVVDLIKTIVDRCALVKDTNARDAVFEKLTEFNVKMNGALLTQPFFLTIARSATLDFIHKGLIGKNFYFDVNYEVFDIIKGRVNRECMNEDMRRAAYELQLNKCRMRYRNALPRYPQIKDKPKYSATLEEANRKKQGIEEHRLFTIVQNQRATARELSAAFKHAYNLPSERFEEFCKMWVEHHNFNNSSMIYWLKKHGIAYSVAIMLDLKSYDKHQKGYHILGEGMAKRFDIKEGMFLCAYLRQSSHTQMARAF